MLKAKDIYKTFEGTAAVEVLKGVSLTIEPHQSCAIVGKSGEGKSTLLHILGTLENPTSGTLEICGMAAKGNGALLRSKHIGFVFQAANLLDDYTALENVLMPARIAKMPANKKRALALLEQVGLLERAHFRAHVLSGGEKQRVAIARALMNDPDILLADEPSGNLDTAQSSAIHQLLLSCKKALVVVTHDENLANLCDRKYHLQGGLICAS